MTTTAASITLVRYDGNSVFVRWLPATDQSVTGYVILVGSSDSGIVFQSAVISGNAATSGTLTLNKVLNSNIVYTVQVQSQTAGGPGDSSPQVALLTALPQVGEIVYDGSDLHFAWGIAQPPAAGFQIVVYSDEIGTTYSVDVTDPLAVSGLIPAAVLPSGGLDPALTWVPRIYALGQNSVIAASPATLALPKPLPTLTVTVAEYQQGAKIVARWSGISGNWVDHYVMRLSSPQGGPVQSIAITNAGATFGVLPLAVPLPENQAFVLSVEALDANGLGVASTPTRVVAPPASLTSAVYDGATVGLTWQGSTDQSVQTYAPKVVSLASGTTWTGTGTVNGGSVPAIGLTAELDCVALVSAQSLNAVPATSIQLPLLVMRPSVTSITYNSETVEVGWTTVADLRVSGYTISILLDSTPVITWDVNDPTTATAVVPLSAPLTQQGNYHVVVAARAQTPTGQSLAATSDLLDIDTSLPVVSSIVYAGGSVTAVWSASGSTGVTGFLITLTSRSGQTFTQTVANYSSTTGSVAVGALGTDEGWQLSVLTQTPTHVSAASKPAGVIATIPTLASVAYSGTAVSADWCAAPDPVFGLASFILTTRLASQTAPDNSQPFTDPSTRSGSVAAASLAADHVVEIRAVAPSGAITVSAPVPAVVATATLATVGYAPGVVSASWTAVAGVGSYGLDLVDAADNGLKRVTTAGTTGLIDGVLDPAQALSMRLVAINGISSGPPGTSVPVIADVAAFTAVETTATEVTANWQAPAQATGVTGYTALLSKNGLVLPVTPTYGTLSAVFTTSVAAGATYEVTVTATGSATTGPESGPAPVIADAPTVLSAVLDGAVLSANWSGISDSRVTGYHVELLQNTTVVASVDTEQTAINVPLALTNGARFTLTVRALAGVAKGPKSAPFAVRGQGFQYYVQPALSTVQPYVFRSVSATPPTTPATSFSLYLPEIFTAAPTLPITAGAFSLTAAAQGSAYPYVVSFDSASPVWTFDNSSIRATLKDNFNAFLTAIEAAGTAEFGLSLVRDVLALGLPLTYAETLFYRYGFEPAQGYCNLDPGMSFSLDGQSYQFEGTSSSATQLNGFVPGGSRAASVGSYFAGSGKHLTGFDGFLSMLSSTTVPTNTRGSAGIVDLYANGFRRPYWRIFYPGSLNGGDSTGSASLNNNMAVLGCNSWEDLEAATAIYLATGNFSTVVADIATTFFRGRLIITPQVSVSVNGTRQFVPLGTSVRQLIQSIAQVPMAANTTFSGLSLQRPTGNLVNWLETSVQLNLGETNPVALAARPYAMVTSQPDVLDLPLLGGDRLFID